MPVMDLKFQRLMLLVSDSRFQLSGGEYGVAIELPFDPSCVMSMKLPTYTRQAKHCQNPPGRPQGMVINPTEAPRLQPSLLCA